MTVFATEELNEVYKEWLRCTITYIAPYNLDEGEPAVLNDFRDYADLGDEVADEELMNVMMDLRYSNTDLIETLEAEVEEMTK